MEKNVVCITKKGMIKISPMLEYRQVSRGGKGVTAMKVSDDDNLVKVMFKESGEDIMILTAKGMALRFPQSHIRVTSRMTSGVRAINLSDDDYVVDMA